MIDFYVFFVESFYEMVVFTLFYVFLVERLVTRCHGVERVRSMTLKDLANEGEMTAFSLSLLTKLEFVGIESQ
jgi:hypothetical protein